MDDSIKFANGELKFKSIDFNDPGWEYFNDGIAGAASPDVIKFPTTCLLYTSPSPRDRQKSRMPA